MNCYRKFTNIACSVYKFKIRYYSGCTKTHFNALDCTYEKFCSKSNRSFCTDKKGPIILGIETSCDDTGCGIVDEHGNVLGEAVNSQLLIHLRNGGVIPPVAQDLHRLHIESVVLQALRQANMLLDDVSAIAVTVKPGLKLSLSVGMKYAKHLAKFYKKPLIPIHHMRAHALTARMENDIPFPFLCLLISGGHCLLTLVDGVDDFKLIGESIDEAPGEAFDKVVRRIKLSNIEEFWKMPGGKAVEVAAQKIVPTVSSPFTLALTRQRDCNFSFCGYKSEALRFVKKKEKLHELMGSDIIPEAFELCFHLLSSITRHLCHRTFRAMEYIRIGNLIPEQNRTLVVSGGVACNNYIFSALRLLCEQNGYSLVRPRPKLCTDNGVMIAWNGMEKWKANSDIMHNFDNIQVHRKYPIGVDIIQEIKNLNIKCTALPLKTFLSLKPNSDLKYTFEATE